MRTRITTYIAAMLALLTMASFNDIVHYDAGYTPT